METVFYEKLYFSESCKDISVSSMPLYHKKNIVKKNK